MLSACSYDWFATNTRFRDSCAASAVAMGVLLIGAAFMPHAIAAGADAVGAKEQLASRPTGTDFEEPKLIPRDVLFGNPTRASARISPDGRWLSYRAPVDGVLNVWVTPLDDLSAARPVTKDTERGVRSSSWAFTGKHILYAQDQKGDENWHVYATDIETGNTIDLTPLEKVNARIVGVSERYPDEVLIGLNDRIPQLHDLYRVNIVTGERELIQQNDGMLAFVTDDDYRVRFAVNYTPTGGQVLYQPKSSESAGQHIREWEEFLQIGAEDAVTTGPAGFDKTGNTLYMLDSRGRDTGALFAIDLDTGESELIVEDERADIGGVLAHPTEKTIEAASYTFDRRKWKILDPSVASDFEYLSRVEDGEFVVTSRTLDDTKWSISYILDDGPVKFYLYDRPAKQAHYLFSSRDDLDEYPLVKMHSFVIKSRDGLDLVCYMSLPPGSDPDGDGRPQSPVPLVVDVHGGPWARDVWGFNPYHQWLANRGYAVVNVNFRGSTGFGKSFVNAANGEWSGKMHDDLLDVVDWVVEQQIAPRDMIAIMGGSYGGYATLVALTFTPEVFRCGVDIVGPSSLITLMENIPPYWAPSIPFMKQRVGDWTTDEGRAELLRRSPLSQVNKIERPLLIGQGANDPRVTQLESDQIVQAMQKKDIPVTYVLFPDEGHGFARPENRMSFNAVTEAFLAAQLGGRFQPVGNDFRGSSITVPVGAAVVPGLTEALAHHNDD